MTENERNMASDDHGAAAGEVAGTKAADSVARRRALLRGMTSGAAAAAAGLPLQALATGGRKHCFHKDAPSKKCKASVSGMHSVISSAMVNDWPESPGKHCTYYKSSWYWPKDGYNNAYCSGKYGQKFTRSAKYKDVFGCVSGGWGSNEEKSIGEIMVKQLAPHCHWVTACLNATKYGTQFSYSPHEVTVLHNDTGKCLDALYFFKNYQENYYS